MSTGPPTVLHLDMDAFFVAVELLDRPDLVGQPVVVGGTGSRGVVAAASYEARSYGVHSAMPSTRARRLCPQAVFLGGRHARYSEVSRQVFDILHTATPVVEGISLDEAFLDVAGARRLLGDAPTVAAGLRARIAEELGLSCSVGVAPRKLTAKLASEAAKPSPSRTGPVPGRGVVVVSRDEELAFLHAHPVRALWGVGPKTARRLDRFGVRTVGDLAAVPEASLVEALGSANGRHLHALAWARDERPVVEGGRPKSVGHEETFPVDHHSRERLGREVVRLADSVGARLRKAGLAGRTVAIKVRFGDFRTITRSVTVPDALDGGRALAAVAGSLLDAVDVSPGVRLLGVSVSGLADGGGQLRLSVDGNHDDGWGAATEAIDAIRGRYGDEAIVPATLTGADGVRVKRRGDQQWGPDQ